MKKQTYATLEELAQAHPQYRRKRWYHCLLCDRWSIYTSEPCPCKEQSNKRYVTN
jgi:hypothetical protein